MVDAQRGRKVGLVAVFPLVVVDDGVVLGRHHRHHAMNRAASLVVDVFSADCSWSSGSGTKNVCTIVPAAVRSAVASSIGVARKHIIDFLEEVVLHWGAGWDFGRAHESTFLIDFIFTMNSSQKHSDWLLSVGGFQGSNRLRLKLGPVWLFHCEVHLTQLL
jgi:hypothetical protein